MFSQSKFTRSHNTHLSFTLCYPESFPQLSRRGLSSLSGTHPALLSHFILSALVFSHPFNNSHKPLEMRYFIMPSRCVRTECNDVKFTRWDTHTQHMVDTLLYSSAKKPRRRHCNSVFVCGLHIKRDTITVHDWFSIRPFDITTLSFITQCYSVKVWLKQTGIQIRFGVVSWLKGLSSL